MNLTSVLMHKNNNNKKLLESAYNTSHLWLAKLIKTELNLLVFGDLFVWLFTFCNLFY